MDSSNGDIRDFTTYVPYDNKLYPPFDNKLISNEKKSNLISRTMDVGSISDRWLYVRGEKIDLKTWEGVRSSKKQMSRLWPSSPPKKEAWEVDVPKLNLRHIIAKGTYGTVYRGVYEDQEVAVKVLDWGASTAAETAEVRSSFRQEVSVWHNLDHPNVTKFIGASIEPSHIKVPTKNPELNGGLKFTYSMACCVVVEYLPGGTLKNYLIRHRRNKLPIKTVVELALDLARGLSYLHSKKIAHRDIKTENMLLGSHRTLKIADFGVARIEAANPREMTGETGTLGYMAPEVIDGKPYNRKCDVYSFAICLWEVYCCEMPYGNFKFIDLATGVVEKNLRPQIPKCCPRSLAKIMKRCWDGNPEKRPEMDEVVRMLEAIDTSKGGGMITEENSSFGCFSLFKRGP